MLIYDALIDGTTRKKKNPSSPRRRAAFRPRDLSVNLTNSFGSPDNRAAVFERDNAARLRLDPERGDELLAAGCIEIDPAEFPILARHWSFVEPNWPPIGQVASEIVARIGSRCAADEDDRDAA